MNDGTFKRIYSDGKAEESSAFLPLSPFGDLYMRDQTASAPTQMRLAIEQYLAAKQSQTVFFVVIPGHFLDIKQRCVLLGQREQRVDGDVQRLCQRR